jgi:hypothetical protein
LTTYLIFAIPALLLILLASLAWRQRKIAASDCKILEEKSIDRIGIMIKNDTIYAIVDSGRTAAPLSENGGKIYFPEKILSRNILS